MSLQPARDRQTRCRHLRVTANGSNQFQMRRTCLDCGENLLNSSFRNTPDEAVLDLLHQIRFHRPEVWDRCPFVQPERRDARQTAARSASTPPSPSATRSGVTTPPPPPPEEMRQAAMAPVVTVNVNVQAPITAPPTPREPEQESESPEHPPTDSFSVP